MVGESVQQGSGEPLRAEYVGPFVKGQQLSCLSRRYSRETPWPAGPQDGVQYGEQLAHTGREGNFLGFTGRQQPPVKVPDDRVVATGDQRPHVQHGPYSGPPSPDGALAAHVTAVPIYGRYAYQGGDLLAIQCPQCRYIR